MSKAREMFEVRKSNCNHKFVYQQEASKNGELYYVCKKCGAINVILTPPINKNHWLYKFFKNKGKEDE